MEQFNFQFMVIKVAGSISDGVLSVKQGLRTFRVVLSEVQMVYAGKVDSGASAFEELVVICIDAAGKQKTFRFQADQGQAGFHAMTEALAKAHVGVKDLRHLSRAEAFKQLPVADTHKIASRLAILIIPLLFAVGGAPLLIHGLDKGSMTISTQELADGAALTSHNITVTQGKILDKGIRETTRRKNGRTVLSKELTPLVPKDWKPGDEVAIVIEQKASRSGELVALGQQGAYSGIARNIWLEGLDGSERKFFEQKLGLKLAKKPIVIDLGAQPGDDLSLYLLIVGLVSAIMAAVGVIMWKKAKL